MSRKAAIFLISLLLMTTAAKIAQAQSTTASSAVLIQEMTGTGESGDLTIPFKKYRFPNGLILILHEDHSDPIVHVDVTYHVGSAREEIGKSGFAHFFEHMMFQGSKNVGDEAHFRIVSEAGGTLNGTTNLDRTNYFETVPRNYLERMLWLEADRMGFLLDAVTQKKFEIQRSTVKNEKGQNYENRPYGMVGEYSRRHFYPFGHPYSWSTIGYVEDLDRVTVEDLKDFFLRWYGPNNAVVTIAGDVDAAEALQLTEKYFGSIPRGPEVSKQSAAPFQLEKDRYISLEDNIRFPMLRMSFPTVPAYHPDEPAIDILAQILGGDQGSILYQKLVKGQKAIQAYAESPCFELAGEFNIVALAYPGVTLAEMEGLIRQSLDEFITRGVTQEDIEKIVAQKQSSHLAQMESVSGKGSMLASYQTFMNDPNFGVIDATRYTQVTRDQVVQAYNQYIRGRKALITSVVPKGQRELAAAVDNYTAQGDTSKVVYNDYSNLSYKPVEDDFNRSKMPKAGEAPAITAPSYYTFTLPNGIKAIGTPNPEVPRVYIEIIISGGHLYNPSGKEGLANLTAAMLEEGTRAMTADEFESALTRLGSNVSVSAGEEKITVGITSLTKNLTPTMTLVMDMLGHPRFAEEDFERLKKQTLESIANRKNQPEALASLAFSRLLYGADHPLGKPSGGTASSIQSITLDDVRNHFHQYLHPANAMVVISGALDKDDAQRNIQTLMGWPPKGPKASDAPTISAAPKTPTTTIYLVDKPGSSQSQIRLGYVALPYDATGDYYRAGIMNYILGGAFNSRINLNLRENKGYTYGARSSFVGSRLSGYYVASAGVRGDVTDSAVREFMYEIKRYAEDGIAKDELAFTKKAILEREALAYETNGAKAGFIKRILLYGLADDFPQQQNAILKKLKRKDIKNLAKANLPHENFYIVVVGDAAKVKPGLEALGYGKVVQLDPEKFEPIQ